MTYSLIIEQPKVLYSSIIEGEVGKEVHYPLHVHNNMTEILFIIEGSSRYQINGIEYTADADSIVVFHQEAWHEERSIPDQPFRFAYLAISGLRLSGLPLNFLLGPDQPPVFSAKLHAFHIKQRFLEIIKEHSNGQPESMFIADMLLSALLAEICRIIHHPAELSSKRTAMRIETVSVVQKYVREHYHQPLTLSDIAKVAFMSSYHLCHIFQQETGVSPIQYAIQYRMEVAQHCLTTTNWPVEEIAERVGYASLTSFHNIFRKHTGFSPGRYRRENSVI